MSSPLLKLHMTRARLLESFAARGLAPEELELFQSLVQFADAILKTNFFKTAKTSLSFRLDPAFLRQSEFPDPLFGMFMVVRDRARALFVLWRVAARSHAAAARQIGSEFRGFHLRFQDIARGGIRLIQSRNAQLYDLNLRSLFDENYSLAHTQQRKNKALACALFARVPI